MTDLFRQEAIDHKRPKVYGTILLTYPRYIAVLSAISGVAILLCVVGFFLLGFARTETLRGVVLPNGGMVDIQAAASGSVQRVLVQEGSQVRQGDLLLLIHNERQTTSGDVVKRVGAALARQQALLQSERQAVVEQGVVRERMAQRDYSRVKQELVDVNQQIRLQEERVALSKEVVQKLSEFAQPDVVPAFMLAEKKADALDQQQRLQELRRQQVALQGQMDALRMQLQVLSLEHQRESGNVDQGIARVQQSLVENDFQGTVEVRALSAGVVLGLSVQPGHSVSAGQTLLHIAPTGANMMVELYASPRAIGLMRVGMPVQIRYDAFPHEKYGQFAGTVRDVSLSPIDASESGRWVKHDANEPLPYRVSVELAQTQLMIDRQWQTVRPGMLLTASAQLEYRRLYEWALKPLKTLNGTAT